MDRQRRLILLASAMALAAQGRARAAQKLHTVRMAKLEFGRAPTGVRVGDVVEWVNADIFQHTVTARDGAFDVDLKPGEKARTVLRAKGVVAYYCRYHPGMTGRIVVAA